MASYFSNHSSQSSRFLANAAAAPQQAQPAPAAAPPRTRQRSKHFSTSVIADDDTTVTGPTNGVHPLRNTWVFWFRQQRAPGNKIISYEEGIKKISAFSSVESFWSLWTHVNTPSSLLPTTDYLLFHSGVRRPVWEDPLNITGGKWIIRLKKGVADRLWEDLVLAIIGDQFDEPSAPMPRDPDGSTEENGTEWPGICGCTISVRQSEDIISIWNRYEADPKVRDRIKETIRKALNLPPTTVMEYKTNNDSMQDKSSFRTTAVDRS